MSTYASQRHCRTVSLLLGASLLAASSGVRTVRAQQADALKIVVLEGDDAVNVIEKKTAVKPAVEVRDRNDLPVAGALVRFAIRGRGATFANSLRQVSVTTDSLGRAAVSELTPLGKGTIEIQVNASFQGQAAAATIHQTNVLTVAEAAQAGQAVPTSSSATAGGGGSGGGLSGTTIAAIAGGAAAGAVGIAAAARGDEPPPPVARAQLDISITPNPTTYGQCVHPIAGVGAPYQLTIKELAGVAFTIESVTIQTTYINAAPITSTATGTAMLPAFTFCDATSGSLTLQPRGTLCTRQCVPLDSRTPTNGNYRTLQWTFEGVDANGNRQTVSAPLLQFTVP